METDEFKGRVGDYWWDAEPSWPAPLRPPPDAPNVLIVLLDDVGFAQLGCFGSDLATPNIDRLAAGGLRYTNFHTTALCSPTRACMLTGRNHHAVGMGRIIDLATGFPGYDARIPKSCGFLPRALVDCGYATWAIGKWHLTPDEETHLAARRDRWPLARGFERFYGFFEGETHQFAPELAVDNHFVDPPGRPEDGYHLTEDLADRFVEFVEDLRHVDVAKPWMAWFTPGACHSPHQAPPEWLEAERGRFDDGWDVWREATLRRQKELGVVPAHTVLSERPDWVPAWGDLTDTERAVAARYMEAFAGFLAHTDAQIGRMVDRLAALGELENTLVLVASDNGASSEGGPVGSLNDARAWNVLPRTWEEAAERIDEIGGPRIHANYPWGWTVAGNTPFRRWKRETHEGGVADPLIVHWPARLASFAGETRGQYVHAIDVMPTVLELVGIDAPETIDGVGQRRIDGTSFAYSLSDASAPERHHTQYYEMFGCRALYHEGFKAVVYHDIQRPEPGLDRVGWELYDLGADPAERHDLAAAEPQRLATMVDLWWAEARRHQVLPLDNRPFSDMVLDRPTGLPRRQTYVYWPGRAPVPERQAPAIKGGRDHRITAFVDVTAPGALEGVLAVQGNVFGGWSFHVVDGHLAYVHNSSGWRTEQVVSPLPTLEEGPHRLAFEWRGLDGGGGETQLLVDDDVISTQRFKRFTWSRFSITGAGLTVGYATGIPPCDDYAAPFALDGGSLDRVEIHVEGTELVDPAAEAADIIARE